MNTNITQSGWFKANVAITLPEDFSEKEFNEINKNKDLTYNMAMTFSEHGKELGEHLPASSLSDSITDKIKDQILEGGNDFGFINVDGKTIDWSLDYENTLDGAEIDFWDLSEENQERIVNLVLDGCYQGELEETAYVDYSYDFASKTEGSLEWDTGASSDVVNFNIDPETKEITFEDDLPGNLENLIKDDIRKDWEMDFGEGPALDDLISDAENKAQTENDSKETKSRDSQER